MMLKPGAFYHFRKSRVVSRPGAVLVEQFGYDIGPEVSEPRALSVVQGGGEVYRPMKQDAKALAKKADPSGQPEYDGSHRARADQRRPSVDEEEIFFPHYHPGGDHDRWGHVFFGARGEDPDDPRVEGIPAAGSS